MNDIRGIALIWIFKHPVPVDNVRVHVETAGSERLVGYSRGFCPCAFVALPLVEDKRKITFPVAVLVVESAPTAYNLVGPLVSWNI
jgi:hypothetical protein